MSVRKLISDLNHLSLRLSNMSDEDLVEDYKTFRMEKEKVTEKQVNLELDVFLSDIKKNHNSYLEYITERIDKTFLEMITTHSDYSKIKHELNRLYLQYQISYRNYYSSKNLHTHYSIINELESALNESIINDDGTPGTQELGGGYKRQSSVKKYKKRRRNRVHTKHKHKKRRYFTYKK
jgi:hypothetical protein